MMVDGNGRSQPPNHGVVVGVRGSVVDATFAGRLPAIYNLLRVGEQDQIAIEVITHVDDRTVRGVALTSTQGLDRAHGGDQLFTSTNRV